jgi:hypothetical protein
MSGEQRAPDMPLNHRLHRIEQIMGEPEAFTPEQRAILDWLSIWHLTPQKRAYLEHVGREDLIDRAEALQPLIEDTEAQRAFLDDLAAQGVTTFPVFLDQQHRHAHE